MLFDNGHRYLIIRECIAFCTQNHARNWGPQGVFPKPYKLERAVKV
nr:DNA-binding protein [Bartonella queenslandensis]